jgi:DNA-binding CsgD family transcriptional regulator
MNRLTNREMQALLEGISMLHSNQSRESLHARIFTAVNLVVPGEFFALDYFRPHGEWLENGSSTSNVDVLKPEHVEAFVAHAAQHPLFCELLRTGLAAPRKITDFVTTSQFHRFAIYNEFYRDVGVDRQIAVGFPAGVKLLLLLTLNRSRKDFTEGDRHLLTLLRPHMMSACQNADALAELHLQQGQLEAALEDCSSGAILIDAEGRVTLVTAQARRRLADYFANPHGSAADLPEELAGWIAHHIGKGPQDRHLSAPVSPLEKIQPHGRLRVRLLRDALTGYSMLLMQEEEDLTISADEIEELGLTKRESEILGWVAQGKTNPEIAILCDISARTVQKHLEHIYPKLGVETRTAAARQALNARKYGPS